MASLVVEDGTGLANANSYVTMSEANAYADARGATAWADASDGQVEALIRATQAIDARYGSSFPGWKSNDRDQALEWPRTDAYDSGDILIPSDEIPAELKKATIEAAIRELASAGSMMPDLERGGAIRRLQAGSVSVEYADNATSGTTYSLIDAIIAPILSARTFSMAGRTARG